MNYMNNQIYFKSNNRIKIVFLIKIYKFNKVIIK